MISQFLSKNKKNQYGNFGKNIQQSSKNGVLTMKVRYQQKQPIKKAQDTVNDFISTQGKFIENGNMMKQILRDKIYQTRQQSQTINLRQIGNIIPWIASPNILFQPFRSLLYCSYNGLPLDRAYQVGQQVDGQILNQIAMIALYKSFKFNQPYFQVARNGFDKDYQGYFTNMYKTLGNIQNYIAKTFKQSTVGTATVTAMQRLKTTTQALLKSATSLVSSAASKWVNSKPSLYQLAQQSKEQTKEQSLWRIAVFNAIDVLFLGMRPCGDFLVNTNYIKQVGSKKTIDGITYYFTYSFPQLHVNLTNSFVTVFILQNNTLSRIPENQFNMKLLKYLISNRITQLGAKLYKNFTKLETMTAQQKTAMTQYRTNYLTLKQIKAKPQQQITQQNLFKYFNSQLKK